MGQISGLASGEVVSEFANRAAEAIAGFFAGPGSLLLRRAAHMNRYGELHHTFA